MEGKDVEESEITQLENAIVIESNEVKDLTVKLSAATQSLSDHQVELDRKKAELQAQ